MEAAKQLLSKDKRRETQFLFKQTSPTLRTSRVGSQAPWQPLVDLTARATTPVSKAESFLAEQSEEDFDKVMSVNATGTSSASSTRLTRW
jgi:hypothetical protein